MVSAPALDGTGCEFDSWQCRIYIYPMFIEPTITWVPSGFSGYIWLDTKIVLKKKNHEIFINKSPIRFFNLVLFAILSYA